MGALWPFRILDCGPASTQRSYQRNPPPVHGQVKGGLASLVFFFFVCFDTRTQQPTQAHDPSNRSGSHGVEAYASRDCRPATDWIAVTSRELSYQPSSITLHASFGGLGMARRNQLIALQTRLALHQHYRNPHCYS